MATQETRRHVRSCNPKRIKPIKPRKKRMCSSEGKSNVTKRFTPTATFALGDEVLVRASDGFLYLAKITRIDEKSHRYCVLFPDGKWDMWALFKDVQKSPNADDIDCVICGDVLSETGNEIVLCDSCGKGYHQQCHLPHIHDEYLDEEIDWDCRECTYLDGLLDNVLNPYFRDGNETPLFPIRKYQESDLHWDHEHRTNAEQYYCYCGGPGQWFVKMLQCCRCQQWFHEACLNCLDFPLEYGDNFYMFVCCWCNEGREFKQRLPMSWKDLAHLILFNLTMASPKLLHRFDQHILPWLSERLNTLQLDFLLKISKRKREKILLKVLNKYSDIFRNGKEARKMSRLFALRHKFPPIPQPYLIPKFDTVNANVMKNINSVKTVEIIVPKCMSELQNLNAMQRVKHPKKNRLSEEGLNNCYSPQQDLNLSNLSDTPLSNAQSPCTPYKSYNHPKIATPLGRIFPRPCNFEGHNHPFKTVLEQKAELQKREIRKQLLNSFVNNVCKSLTADESSTLDKKPSVSEISSLSLENNMPFEDKTSVNKIIAECEGTNEVLNKNESLICNGSLPFEKPCLTKRHTRDRKNVRRLSFSGDTSSDTKPCESVSLVKQKGKKRRRSVIEKDIVDNDHIKQKSPLQKLESTVSGYFGGANRIAEGEKFTVLAKRLTSDGRLEYLIDWN